MAKENKSVKNFPNSRNVPKLRFWEFANEWRAYYLKEIAEKINNKNNDNKIITVFSNSAVQGIVLQSDYFDKSIANKENLDGYYIVKPFDFVYNPRLSSMAEVGAMSVNKTNLTGLVSPLYTVFRIKEKNVNIPFLEYLFKSKVWHNYMRSIANYGARDDRMNVKSDDFYNLPLFIPCFSEQKKVSTFLSLIENRIQTQKKIIEDTRKMKLNFSHNLFTQNFRISKKYISKWEEKTLGDISTIIMGQSPDSSAYNSYEKGLPLIQGNADIVQRFSKPRQFTSQITKTCDIGDIILTIRAPVGHAAKSKHFACIGRGVCAIKSNEKSDSEFIYQFLLYFENKWSSFEQGSTFTSVNSSDIKTIKINVPTIEEQREIAQFLKTFDEKINIETELLAHYENQKKYLLQNLFV
ncbi:restriction endonuclease subunit S [Cloacibacterium sp. TD35]|uniref:restriction endonuclease subunit S n=1 Tax=Cloacibacterium sp. TD35 TaxID=2976818 RepID=UPI00237DCF6B|nr:restriction endonuclease subunit S [Cloacibacterium sp. TD35]WDT68019.1 restriction endonuclease subunit S [Cloacibacterium sp. TD35]